MESFFVQAVGRAAAPSSSSVARKSAMGSPHSTSGRRITTATPSSNSNQGSSSQSRSEHSHIFLAFNINPFKFQIPSFCVCPFTSSVSEHPVRRSYSVSCSPGLGHLRISVRKEGAASSFLHESVAVGDVIK